MATQYAQDTQILYNICDAEITSDKEFHEVFAKDTSYHKEKFRAKVYRHVYAVRCREPDLYCASAWLVKYWIVRDWIAQHEAELQFINNIQKGE